jgi:hypothetical protein
MVCQASACRDAHFPGSPLGDGQDSRMHNQQCVQWSGGIRARHAVSMTAVGMIYRQHMEIREQQEGPMVGGEYRMLVPRISEC